MNPTDNQGYRTNESVGKMFLHSCLGKFVILAIILLVLFIIAVHPLGALHHRRSHQTH